MIIRLELLKRFYVKFKTITNDGATYILHAMIKDSWQHTMPSWQLRRKWIINLPVLFRYKHDPHIIFS